MTTLGLLPIIGLLLFLAVIPGKNESLGEKFLASLLVWGIVIVVLTEGLSLVGLLTSLWTTLFWLLFVSTLIVFLARSKPSTTSTISPKLVREFTDQKVLVASILTICAITLLIALVAPPNNWDSMTFHMTRVANWVQNASVEHYQTYTDRQLHSPPFAEFAILQFQLLSGGDRFANLVQWGSMIGSLAAVCLIANKLGATRTGLALSAVYAATIPMGILQSTSTQTDYVVTLWLTCFIYFLLIGLETQNRWNTVKLGAALGIAILTKITAYIYAFPFLGWYFVAKIRRQPLNLLSQIATIGALIIIVNAGHFSRNLGWFGSVIGPTYEADKNANGRFGVDVTVSNLLRNGVFHLASPSKRINNSVYDIVYKLHEFIGIDINDSSTTKSPPYHIRSLSTHEDFAGNPLHFIIAIISFCLLFLHPKIHHKQMLVPYSCMVVVGFVLFCAYMRWSPWRQRLHLPLFVLIAPVVGIALSQTLSTRSAGIVAYGFLLASLLWLLSNHSRPLVPFPRFSRHASILTTNRVAQYFVNRPHLKSQYLEAVDVLTRQPCRKIGLVSGGDDYEYPLFVLLHATGEPFTLSYPAVPSTEAYNEFSTRVCTLVYVGDGKEKLTGPRNDEEFLQWDDLIIVRQSH